MPIKSDDPDFVNSLARGLSVVTVFGHDAEQLTLSEVSERTGLTRGTARRFLLTLEALGYLRSDGRNFQLAPKALDLGYAYLSSMPLWKAAQGVMQEVVDELGEACSLGVLDGHDVVYIAHVPPKHFLFVPVKVGTRMPAYLNAMGQVLLADLDSASFEALLSKAEFAKFTEYTVMDRDAIRARIIRAGRDGFAVSDQQLQVGLRSIAAPIRSKSRRVEAAINATAGQNRASKKELIRRFLPVLERAARKLSNAV